MIGKLISVSMCLVVLGACSAGPDSTSADEQAGFACASLGAQLVVDASGKAVAGREKAALQSATDQSKEAKRLNSKKYADLADKMTAALAAYGTPSAGDTLASATRECESHDLKVLY